MHSHPTELTGPAHARVHAPQANAHCWHRHARTRCMRASLCCALLHTHHLYALPNNRGREDIRPGVYSHAEWNQRADTRFSALRMARSGVGMRCLGVLYSRTKSPSQTRIHATTHRLSLSVCARTLLTAMRTARHPRCATSHGSAADSGNVRASGQQLREHEGCCVGVVGLLQTWLCACTTYGKIQHGAEHIATCCNVL
jgi:hypothetical protein